MYKLAALAVAVGVLTASCAGHGGTSSMPAVPQSPTGGPLKPSSTAAAPAGWATTDTLALTLPSGATDMGAATPGTPMTVRVALQMQNVSQLQQLVASGQTIDDATFMSTYAPTSTQVQSVVSYLQSQGFTNVAAEPNNLLVSATGTVAQADTAFDTSIHSVSINGVTALANVQPAYVPTSLAGVAISVLGLNTVQNMHAIPQKQTPTPCTVSVGTTCPRFYDPSTFDLAYNTAGVAPANNTSLAVMAEGTTTQAVTDFRYNEKEFGMPQVPVQVVQVGLQSPDAAGDDEWTLDMTYSQAMAGTFKTLYLYQTTSLTDSDIALEYNKWVTQKYAKVGNSSFGGCELFEYLDGSMVAMDQTLLQGAAEGMTMFASSGDSGSFCSAGVPNGIPAGAPFVEYPASSPYVNAVGGTDLFTNADGSYLGESAWESGGGGLSQFEYSPYWETTAQPVSSNGESFRGVPDVAMDASLETGALLYLGGTEYITGGTSLASPLAAGSWARMQNAHAGKLGFAPIAFYKNYQANPTASATLAGPPPTAVVGGFHDILSGSNVGYTALPRYDYTTGLGSLNVTSLNSQI